MTGDSDEQAQVGSSHHATRRFSTKSLQTLQTSSQMPILYQHLSPEPARRGPNPHNPRCSHGSRALAPL